MKNINKISNCRKIDITPRSIKKKVKKRTQKKIPEGKGVGDSKYPWILIVMLIVHLIGNDPNRLQT